MPESSHTGKQSYAAMRAVAEHSTVLGDLRKPLLVFVHSFARDWRVVSSSLSRVLVVRNRSVSSPKGESRLFVIDGT